MSEHKVYLATEGGRVLAMMVVKKTPHTVMVVDRWTGPEGRRRSRQSHGRRAIFDTWGEARDEAIRLRESRLFRAKDALARIKKELEQAHEHVARIPEELPVGEPEGLPYD